MSWEDKNNDGVVQYRGPMHKQENELYFGNDIMVMANPSMANLPMWVIALLMAGCIAAALSTAAGLLVLSTSISHDLMKKIIRPELSDKEEVKWARIASFIALLIATYFGINPPSSFIAKTVAFAFGLAASSFFPTLLLGIFSKRMNKEGRNSRNDCRYWIYIFLYCLFSVHGWHFGSIFIWHYSRGNRIYWDDN